jgi:hypothetical protein
MEGLDDVGLGSGVEAGDDAFDPIASCDEDDPGRRRRVWFARSTRHTSVPVGPGMPPSSRTSWGDGVENRSFAIAGDLDTVPECRQGEFGERRDIVVVFDDQRRGRVYVSLWHG